MPDLHVPEPYRLAWIGPQDPQCDTLLDQFNRTCDQLNRAVAITQLETFDFDAVSQCDRVVLVAASRASYPIDAISELASSRNIVPWGVVTGSWFIGSRRSGQGAVDHWQQPWFRWWDSWCGWFFPQQARDGSLVPSTFAPVIAPLDFATPNARSRPSAVEPRRRLMILCACRQTLSMLEDQAHHVGWDCEVVRYLPGSFPTQENVAEFVVWDDSLLTAFPEEDLRKSMTAQYGHLSQHFPCSRIVVMLDLEHLSLWNSVRHVASQLIVKPSPALGLCNLLHFYSSHGQVA